MARKQDEALRERILLAIGCTVTIVWAVATLVQVVFPDRPVSGEVHLVMMTVAGFFFGGAALEARKKQNGDGNGDDSK